MFFTRATAKRTGEEDNGKRKDVDVSDKRLISVFNSMGRHRRVFSPLHTLKCRVNLSTLVLAMLLPSFREQLSCDPLPLPGLVSAKLALNRQFCLKLGTRAFIELLS